MTEGTSQPNDPGSQTQQQSGQGQSQQPDYGDRDFNREPGGIPLGDDAVGATIGSDSQQDASESLIEDDEDDEDDVGSSEIDFESDDSDTQRV